jgi:hypothetical protein
MTASSQTWPAPALTPLAQAKKALDDGYENDKDFISSFNMLDRYSTIILELMKGMHHNIINNRQNFLQTNSTQLNTHKANLLKTLKEYRSSRFISSKKGDPLELLIPFNSYLISLCSKTAATFAQEEEVQPTLRIKPIELKEPSPHPKEEDLQFRRRLQFKKQSTLKGSTKLTLSKLGKRIRNITLLFQKAWYPLDTKTFTFTTHLPCTYIGALTCSFLGSFPTLKSC